MKKNDFTRRRFITAVSAGSLATVAGGAIPVFGKMSSAASKLAILAAILSAVKIKPGPSGLMLMKRLLNQL